MHHIEATIMAYSKTPIKLRQRKMPSGTISLYLDIYIDGQRTYEYLKLYLIPEKSKADKLLNRDTMGLAEAICSKRIIEFRNGRHGFKKNKASALPFLVFYDTWCRKKYGTDNTNKWGNYSPIRKIITACYPNNNIRMSDITQKWIEGIKAYMDTQEKRLSINTRARYLIDLIVVIKQAVKSGHIASDPTASVERYSTTETQRMYLTADEIRTLWSTECRNDVVKCAFLFSCLTGLRYSDILKLKWGDVYTQNDFTRLIFRQKKTKGQEYLDIAEQAVSLMGERQADDRLVFEGLATPATIGKILRQWVAKAGINKHITFHCARHTFATLMLDIGTDLYTVSKLLGHREIGTTQIYAKIMDKNKQKAVASIPNLIE